MKGNTPIPELKLGEEVWLIAVVTSVRERRSQQGKLFCEAQARNSTGSLSLRIWSEALEKWKELRSGLWRITGRLESFQDRLQFVLTEYRTVPLEEYREHQGADPILPRAYTMDIETLALVGFRARVGAQLEKSLRLGKMPPEQKQRYFESSAAEEERCYQLGSLSAASGRVLCIAVHVGAIPGLEIEGIDLGESETVFGIDGDGNERDEKQTLSEFLNFMKGFDPESDELVGHNIIGFDLPFIFQRCLAHCLSAPPFVELGEFRVRGVFDTMHHWWLGARRTVSLDDIAWALGIPSSKTGEVEGSKVFDFYQAGRLAEIREYNLNDVRVTRKIYERMMDCFRR